MTKKNTSNNSRLGPQKIEEQTVENVRVRKSEHTADIDGGCWGYVCGNEMSTKCVSPFLSLPKRTMTKKYGF